MVIRTRDLLNEHNRRRTREAVRRFHIGTRNMAVLANYRAIVTQLTFLGVDRDTANRAADRTVKRFLATAAGKPVDDAPGDHTIAQLPADLYPQAGLITVALDSTARLLNPNRPSVEAGVSMAHAAELLLTATR